MAMGSLTLHLSSCWLASSVPAFPDAGPVRGTLLQGTGAAGISTEAGAAEGGRFLRLHWNL